MPARCASSASASAVSGVSGAGLTTKVQPAARPGGHLRVIIAAGKFQGVIAAQTPTGCFWTMMREFGAARDGLAVDALGFLGVELDEGGGIGDLAAASASGLPCSAVMIWARSS
jgi:hypothetical protein